MFKKCRIKEVAEKKRGNTFVLIANRDCGGWGILSIIYTTETQKRLGKILVSHLKRQNYYPCKTQLTWMPTNGLRLFAVPVME